MATPEGRVKARIKRVLKKHGVWFFMPVPYGMGVHGIPDFICCFDGRFLAIEAKAPRKKKTLTMNQAKKIREIIDHGGIALVVDDADALDAYLSEIKA